MRELILYAPNVHTGGGLVLLRALLTSWRRRSPCLTAFLDFRAHDLLHVPDGCHVHWVESSPLSRLKAEFNLYRQANRSDTTVFCFHSLPPIFANKAKIILYQQNRNYLGINSLSTFAVRTRIRLTVERLIAKLFRERISTYIVQTPTMKRALFSWYQHGRHSVSEPDIRVLPFMDDVPLTAKQSGSEVSYDFVYVADGEAHKNHRNLLKAWVLLADEGLRPTLALTLTLRDSKLREEVVSLKQAHHLAIVDLGHLPHEEILALYMNSRALIFPSTSESLGLPLIEAFQAGLPILAGELDYVRDVCVPSETFDPDSPTSIARAVKRFLGNSDGTIFPYSAAEFLDYLLQASDASII